MTSQNSKKPLQVEALEDRTVPSGVFDPRIQVEPQPIFDTRHNAETSTSIIAVNTDLNVNGHISQIRSNLSDAADGILNADSITVSLKKPEHIFFHRSTMSRIKAVQYLSGSMTPRHAYAVGFTAADVQYLEALKQWAKQNGKTMSDIDPEIMDVFQP